MQELCKAQPTCKAALDPIPLSQSNIIKPCSTLRAQPKNTLLFLKSWGDKVLLVLLPLISGYWSYLVNGFIFFAEEEILSPLLLGLVKLLPWGPVDQLLSSKQLWQATGVGSPAATPACPSYHSLEREQGIVLEVQ